MLRTLDLFAGIGGFSRGLEATGFFETICFVENEPYCQAVLKHHWPGVPILGDIKNVKAPDLPSRPDVICGGFPCQPFSQAGKQRAQDDPRHLWPEMFRLIRECRPTWVVGENVAGIIKLGLDEVLADLEGEGYATRTFNIPACAVGAPHLRQRLWIVAHSDSESEPDKPLDGGAGARQLGFEFGGSEAAPHGPDPDNDGSHRATEHKQNTKHGKTQLRDEQVRELGSVGQDVADPESVHGQGSVRQGDSRGKPEKKAAGRGGVVGNAQHDGLPSSEGRGRLLDKSEEQRRKKEVRKSKGASGSSRDVADPQHEGDGGRRLSGPREDKGKNGQGSSDQSWGCGETLADPRCDTEGSCKGVQRGAAKRSKGSFDAGDGGDIRPEERWAVEPDVGRLVDGLPNRVPQLRALGNSIVPQIAQEIGQAIRVAHDHPVESVRKEN